MDHDGHNFESKAILDWIQKGEDNIGIGICPVSHKPLQRSDLIPNATLKETIRRWSNIHGRHCRTPSGSMPIKHVIWGDKACQNAAATNQHNQKKQATTDHADCDHSTVLEEEDELHCSSIRDSLELGGAIKSLSTALSAKEDYVMDINDKDDCEDKETEDAIISGRDEVDEEQAVQVGAQATDLSASLLLNMYLPQEREAMIAARTRARERHDAESLARLTRASIVISMSAVVLVLMLFLARFVSSAFFR